MADVLSDEDLARRLQEEEIAAHDAAHMRRQQVVQQTNEIASTIRASPRFVAVVVAFSIIEFITSIIVLQTTESSGTACQYFTNIQMWLSIFLFRHMFTIPHELYRCRAQMQRDAIAVIRSRELDTIRLYVFVGAVAMGLYIILGKTDTAECLPKDQHALTVLKGYTLGLIALHLTITFSSVLIFTMLCLCLPCVLLVLQNLQPHQGLDNQELETIPEVTFQSNEQRQASNPATCVICQVDFADGDRLKHLQCNHEFHSECLDQWLSLKATCPLCREPIKGRAGPVPPAPADDVQSEV